VPAFAIPAAFWPVWNWATTGSFVHGYLSVPVEDAAALAAPAARDTTHWVPQLFVAMGSIVTTSMYWIDSAGPFVIAALAGVLLFRKPAESRLPGMLVVSAVAFYLFVLAVRLRSYLWIDSHARYLGPCLLGFGALAAAPFLDWMKPSSKFVRTALVVGLLLPAIPLVFLKAGKAAVAIPVVVGLESRSHYLAKKIETYEACEILNTMPDPNVRVLFFAHRSYYLDRVMAPYLSLVGVRTREDLIRRIREHGITHVVYEPARHPQSWLKDPDDTFGRAPFVELRRWPWKQQGYVRLYAVEKP